MIPRIHPNHNLKAISFALCMGLLGCSQDPSGVKTQFSRIQSKVAKVEVVEKKSPQEIQELEKWCEGILKESKRVGWPFRKCNPKDYTVFGKSVEGRPLVYREFGNKNSHNTTLVLSMVHPDEQTPLYIVMKIMEWMELYIHEYPDAYVVVAPMVNPDGFFRTPRTRVNARGVDVNRNFNTHDWYEKAMTAWKKETGANPRRFPGKSPVSEPETLFQVEILAKFKPTKILSIHAPLNFLDYDGPDVVHLSKFAKEHIEKCLNLRERFKATSKGFYPGSLGNFAGQELGIPTLTFELPSANPALAPKYWKQFRGGMKTLVDFKVPSFAGSGMRDSDS